MCQELACRFYGAIVPLTVRDKIKMAQKNLNAHCVLVIKQIKHSKTSNIQLKKNNHLMFSVPRQLICAKQALTVTPQRNIHQISIQLSNTITTLLHKCEEKPESCREPLVKRQVCSETSHSSQSEETLPCSGVDILKATPLCALYLG